ncbi:MAG: hypothetical protein ACRDTS_14855, partial [Mycobacterium sp.]
DNSSPRQDPGLRRDDSNSDQDRRIHPGGKEENTRGVSELARGPHIVAFVVVVLLVTVDRVVLTDDVGWAALDLGAT